MVHTKQPSTFLCIGLAVFFGCLLPRLCMLGTFPYMDEGHYIYHAQSIWQCLTHTGSLPQTGSLNLYSLVLAPLTGLSGNIFVPVRLADALFAAVFGVLFVSLLIRECGRVVPGALVGALALLCLNATDIAQAGAKNSFFLAYIPLIIALTRVLYAQRTGRSFFLAGMMTALGVLLREPFAIYSVIGVVGCLCAFGLRAALLYAAGGILAGSALISVLALLRHSFLQLVTTYANSVTIFAAEAGRVTHNALHYGLSFCLHFWPLLLVFLLSLVLLAQKGDRKLLGRALFWGALILAPFVEILTKISFLYHYSMTIVGLAGLMSVSLRLACQQYRKGEKLLCAVLACAFLLTVPGNIAFSAVPMTVRTLMSPPSHLWDPRDEAASNPLQAGGIIRSHKGSLTVSGFLYLLYPICKKLPPDIHMEDLSRVYLLKKKDAREVRAYLLKNPPDLIALGTTNETDHVAMFTEELTRIVQETGQYALLATVPLDASKNYGWIGCDIYQRIPNTRQ